MEIAVIGKKQNQNKPTNKNKTWKTYAINMENIEQAIIDQVFRQDNYIVVFNEQPSKRSF